VFPAELVQTRQLGQQQPAVAWVLIQQAVEAGQSRGVIGVVFGQPKHDQGSR